MSEEGNCTSLQYSCLENPMDRGAWRAIVHGVARVGYDLTTKPPPPPYVKITRVHSEVPTGANQEERIYLICSSHKQINM